MHRAVLICPDPELSSRLEQVASHTGRVDIVRSTDRYLNGHELERFLRANAPQLVYLSIESMARAMELVETAERLLPGVQVIAIDRLCDSAVLLDLMRNGVREFLAYPFDQGSFLASVTRLEDILAKSPAKVDGSEHIYSFLPAKAGVGASTAALNTAVCLSQVPDTHVLLMDLDLNSGMLGFMLKIVSGYTIYEAAESAHRLDEHLWPQLVAGSGNMDLLPAGRLDPQTRIEPSQVRQIISFARRFYDTICIDLSGNMEKFSLDVMHDSRRIFLVSTAEIPALHLARQKLNLLHSLDLLDRVSVLLNRWSRNSIVSVEQVQKLLGVPVFMELPNDYRGVHLALTEGRAVDGKSELGKKFTKLAYDLLEKKAPHKTGAQKRKFLEFFTAQRRDLYAPVKD